MYTLSAVIAVICGLLWSPVMLLGAIARVTWRALRRGWYVGEAFLDWMAY